MHVVIFLAFFIPNTTEAKIMLTAISWGRGGFSYCMADTKHVLSLFPAEFMAAPEKIEIKILFMLFSGNVSQQFRPCTFRFLYIPCHGVYKKRNKSVIFIGTI